MKKTIIIIAVLFTAASASAQTNEFERIIDNAKSELRWKTTSTINRGIDAAFEKSIERTREKNRERKERKAWECPSCHSKNHSDYCPECGTKKPTALSGWTCHKCGHHNSNGNYCEDCGTPRNSQSSGSTDGMKPLKNMTENRQLTITLDQLSQITNKY